MGNFVVAYTAYDKTYSYTGYRPCYDTTCLFTRRNLENGDVAPAVFKINDPSQTNTNQIRPDEDQNSNPEIVSLPTGEFVVLWEGYDYYDYGNGSFGIDEGVFGRLTVKIGQTKGGSFRINETSMYYQGQYGDLAGAGGPDGDFVVAFRDEGACCGNQPGGSIRVGLFDKRGRPRLPEFGVSSEDEDGYVVDVAQAANGNFMVTWASDRSEGTGRIFDADGNPLTNDFELGADVSGSYREPPLRIAASDDSFVVTWSDDQVLARRFDHAGVPLTDAFQVNTQLDASWSDIAAMPNGDFVVAYKDTDYYIRAQQFQVAFPDPIEMPIPGKALILKNKVPDDPYKNGAKWKASLAKTIEAPPRGGDGDPRCNGDPVGTAKAVLRFVSPTSGHDSQPIPLYCQNWFATGSSAVSTVGKRGYSYADSRLELGPCNMVKIGGTKSLTVSCKAKKGIRTFDYDLEPGVSEGTVHAILELGRYRYCSEFTTVGSGDGSDGKKFKGRKADAGAACLPGYFTLRQCGNTEVGYDEVCDDGNTDDGDYCSFDCRRETSICGDSQTGADEACDDGNTSDGDYCSADCRVETAVCGDSQVGPGEVCDDGNTNDEDYCRSDCQRITAVCGDTDIGPGEACDDGDTADGDYCNADCTQVTAVCGDGAVGPGECCDDGDTTPATDAACDATCTSGSLCPPCNFSPGDYSYCWSAECGPCTEGMGHCRYQSECASGLTCVDNIGPQYGFRYWVDVCKTVVCGDGVQEGAEACDDGNTEDGDSCSADCSTRTSVCGDGLIEVEETCDDSNASASDGCDDSCQIELIQTETEPNNTPATADPLLIGGPGVPGLLRGAIVGNSEDDYFFFELTSTTTVTVNTLAQPGGPWGDTQLWIYNNSGSELGYNDDGGPGYYSRLTLALAPGTYRIKIDEYGRNGNVDYDLFVSVD
ncbi:MAG: DVUA0089 family protein [Candidatus Binatia bacterium]|nr:DVUA0089 family protein [Candidatus Binatia bacterium]